MDLNLLLKQFNQKKIQNSKHQNKNDKVVIIDGMNNFIIQYAANPIRNTNGIPIGGTIGFLKSLVSFIQLFNPTRIIVVFDGIKGASKRKSIFKQYKQNRSQSSNGIHSKYLEDFSIEQCRQNMAWQLRRIVQYLLCLPVTVISKDYIEADDVIALLSKKIQNSNIVIVSTDKDYLQLINKNVSVWSPVKKFLYTQNQVKNQFKVNCNNFILFKSTIGDPSDNIDGITGIQLKTFNKLFPELQNEDKTFEQFLQSISLKQGKTKSVQNLKEGIQKIKRNYQIMQLSDSIINPQTQLKIIQQVNNSEINFINKLQFIKLNIDDALNNVTIDTQQFLSNFYNLQFFAKKWNKELKEQ